MTRTLRNWTGGRAVCLPVLSLLILLLLVVCGCTHDEPAPEQTDPLAVVPDDIPIYPMGRFLDIKVSEIGLQARFATTATAPEVVDWYQKHLASLGWRIVGVVGENPQMLIARKEQRSVTVSLVEADDTTQANALTVNYSTRF